MDPAPEPLNQRAPAAIVRSAPSDEALLAACRQGDAAAWEQLVTRYKQLVFAVPLRAGLDRELAADVFQHVFATLVEKLHQIEHPERIRAWLVTTARRETLRLRRRDRGGQTSLDNPPWEGEVQQPADDPLPDDVVLQLEEQHLVRSSLAALGGRCRQLLALLFYRSEPAPYAEIAAVLNISEGSIGPTRARCLQKLLALLEKAGM